MLGQSIPRGLVLSISLSLLCGPTLRAQEEPKKSPSPPVQEGVGAEVKTPGTKNLADKKSGDKSAEGWTSLIPKRELGDWVVTDFGSQGKVKRDGPEIILEMGDPLTGINRKQLGDFPKSDYEIELECKRIEGNDFLCGLTFPVGDEFCSFIAGGWGGGLVGLSSVDGMDASENSTSSYVGFDNNKWYKFRVRVDDEYVKAWIDDKEVIRQDREHSEFSTRIEVYVSQPLGFCVFQSTVAVRNFKWRPVKAEDPKAAEPGAEKDTGKKDTGNGTKDN